MLCMIVVMSNSFAPFTLFSLQVYNFVAINCRVLYLNDYFTATYNILFIHCSISIQLFNHILQVFMLLVLDACNNDYDTGSTSSACSENVTHKQGQWR